jgi:hypothetical protein
MTAVLNGQRRPNLSDQIDRLDKILDGLAEGLNDAVVSAVQIAVQAAVKEATESILRELFTSAAVLPALAAALSPATPKPPLGSRIGAGCRWLWRKMLAVFKTMPSSARHAPVALVTGLRQAASAARRLAVNRVTKAAAVMVGLFTLAWRLRHFVPMALTVGAAAATLGYCSTPELVALLHGLTAATLAVVVRLSSPMRRTRPATS